MHRLPTNRNVFCNHDKTNCGYDHKQNTENIEGSIPSYRTEKLPERYGEALLKMSNLTKHKN